MAYYIAVVVIGAAIGWWLSNDAADNKPPSPGAPQIDDFDMSTAKYGAEIPDVLGITKITGNIFWYCCNRTKKLTETQQVGKDDKETYTTGYKYYLTWAIGLCVGPVDTLYAVYEGKNLVWEGELNRPANGGEETIVLDGMGSMTFYFGTDDQAPNSIIGNKLGSNPNIPYRHICWAFFDDCFINKNNNRAPVMKFVLRKSPIFNFNGNNVIAKYNYNPVHALWYILSQSGMCDLDSNYLDPTTFSNMADILSTEGRGISILFNRSRAALSYIESILAHIDGSIKYGNTGKFLLALNRADINFDDIPQITEEDILEDIQLDRKSWLDTTNVMNTTYAKLVRGHSCASYFDPTTLNFYESQSGGGGPEITEGGIDFQADAFSLQDAAHISSVNRTNSKNFAASLYNTYDNISWLTDRYLRSDSYPLARIVFPVNRNCFRYEPGDLFKLRYTPYNMEQVVFRVAQIRETALDSEVISITAIEDKDYIAAYSNREVIGGTGIAVSQSVTPLTHIKILEAPWLFGLQTGVVIVPLVAREKGYEVGYQLHFSTTGSIYVKIGCGTRYAPHGTLVNQYPDTTNDFDTTVGFEIDFSNSDVDDIETITLEQVEAGYNLAILGDEILCLQTITPVSGNTYAFSGIARGKYDTTKVTHSAGAEFYFIGMSYDRFEYMEFIKGETVYFKLVPYSSTDVGDLADATAKSIALTGRAIIETDVYSIQAPAYSQAGENTPSTQNATILEENLESTISGELGETIIAADRMTVYLHSDGKYYKAKADGTKQPAIGIVVEVKGTAAQIKRTATITKASWAWTPGNILYLSPTVSGGLTSTRPDSHSQTLAFALNATTIYFVGNIDQSAAGGIFDTLKLTPASDYFGSAAIPDESASQTDPASMTSTDIVSADAGTVTTADADDTYGAAEKNLINEIKADYNTAVTLINETKVDYNLLRADVSDIHTVIIGTIDYNDALKAKINALLVELRKTGGCGILDD